MLIKLSCLALLLGGSLLACKEDTPGPNQQFGLMLQRPTTLPAPNAVQATLTELSDSRCPSGGVCIWAGTLSATVALTDERGTQTVRLGYQRPYGADSVAVVLAGRSYWLRLLDAQPYPSTTNGSLPRTAFFRLRPQ